MSYLRLALLASLSLALGGCGSCSCNKPPEPAPPSKVPATAAKPVGPSTQGPPRHIKDLKIRNPKLLQDKMKGFAPKPVSELCKPAFPGDDAAKLAEVSEKVAPVPTLAPGADRRIPDRLLVRFARDTTVAQANGVLRDKGLRVGAFSGQTPFATLCTTGLGTTPKLDEAAADLAKLPLVESAQVALGGAQPK